MARIPLKKRFQMTREGESQGLHVFHVGICGDRPGGMAQVVNQYLSWNVSGVKVRGLLSTRCRRDPLSPALALFAAVRLVFVRYRRPNVVVVVHLSERGSFAREGLLLLVSIALGIPTIAHLHGAEFVVSATPRWEKLIRVVLRNASLVLVLTNESERQVLELNLGTIVKVVPNMVPVPSLPTYAKQNTLIFGGELSKRKGVDVLLQAWARSRAPGWTLKVAGPTADVDIKEFDLRQVELLGSVKNSTVLNELTDAAIALLPSRAEALPMFLLEAMARRCAVISTQVGQIPALLERGSGITVEAGDVTELSDAIASLIENGELRRSVADKGYMRVAESYSIERQQREIIDVWRYAANLEGTT